MRQGSPTATVALASAVVLGVAAACVVGLGYHATDNLFPQTAQDVERLLSLAAKWFGLAVTLGVGSVLAGVVAVRRAGPLRSAAIVAVIVASLEVAVAALLWIGAWVWHSGALAGAAFG